jgi:hypothetical protein
VTPAASLSLEAWKDARGYYQFKFTTPTDQDGETWESENPASMVDAQVTDIRQELRRARRMLPKGGGPCDLADAQRYVEVLEEVGGQVLFRTFGQALADVLHYIQEALARVFATPQGLADAPYFEIKVADDLLIPFEALPLLDRSEVGEFKSLADLRRAMLRFPGMSAVVYRVRRKHHVLDTRLSARPRLRVKMFYDGELRGARIEARALRRHLDVDGPWPDDAAGESADIRSDAIEYIANHELGFDGASREPDQVQHFSCHCTPSREGSKHHSIHLGNVGGPGLPLTIGDLESKFGKGVGNATKSRYARPLVFLNGCETAASEPGDYTQWSSPFLSAGWRGFLGTEVDMPEGFAARFAIHFYGHLLAGHAVGQALHRTRWDLLNRWSNPLGLLYTFRGNPDLHVEFPEEVTHERGTTNDIDHGSGGRRFGAGNGRLAQ